MRCRCLIAVNIYIDDKLSDLEPLQHGILSEDGLLLKDRVRDILRDKSRGSLALELHVVI